MPGSHFSPRAAGRRFDLLEGFDVRDIERPAASLAGDEVVEADERNLHPVNIHA